MATYYVTSPLPGGFKTQNVAAGDTIEVKITAWSGSISASPSSCSVSYVGFYSGGHVYWVTNFTSTSYDVTFTDSVGSDLFLSGSVTQPTDSGTISINSVVEGQNLTVTVNVTSIATSTWHYDIDRLTGDFPEGVSPSALAFTPTLGTQTFTVATGAGNDPHLNVSEMQFQGEQFIIYLKTGGTVGSGTIIDQQNVFRIYDDDNPITAFNNPINVSSGATSHTQYITFGNFSTLNHPQAVGMPFRIYRADIQQTVFTGTAFDNNGTATCVVNNVPASGSSAAYTIYINNGITEYFAGAYTVNREATPLIAPVISSVSDNNAAAPSVTTTVNLSSTGSGGTLQYISKNSSATPAYNDSGWQTSNVFTQSRNTNFFYWAQQVSGTNRAISSPVAKYIGFISPDTSIAVSPTSQQVPTSNTSHTVTISGGSSLTQYQVRNNAGTVAYNSRTGNGDITVNTTVSSLTTFRIYARVPTTSGGNGVYSDTGTTYTVDVFSPTTRNVSFFADPETNEIFVSGGGSSSSRIQMVAGDILQVSHDNFVGDNITATVSTFSSAYWTSTTSMSLSPGQSATRQIKTSPTLGTFNLSISASGYTSGTIYIEVIATPPPTSAQKPDAFGVSSISGAALSSEVHFNTVSVSGNTATATSRVSGGVQQRKSPTGTWTTADISVNAGDSVYLRTTSASTYSTVNNYSLRIGDIDGVNGEGYDYETATFSLSTVNDPGIGQTVLFPISSGTISMKDIIEFFDYPVNTSGVGPKPAGSLSDYYRGGLYVPNVTGNSGIPTSGTIELDDFYGSETRWYVTAPALITREQNTLGGPSSFTLSFSVYPALFGGGYGPNVGVNSEYRNDSIVEVWSNNAGPLTVTGGSSTYTENWTINVSMSASANQEREFYGYIPVDARSRVNPSLVQTGLRVYFLIFFYGP